MEVKQKKQTVVFDTDEGPRPNVTAESISKLRPAFKEGGVVTAGNSSGINDAAAALIVMSEEKAKELGVKPMATWVAGELAGVEPVSYTHLENFCACDRDGHEDQGASDGAWVSALYQFPDESAVCRIKCSTAGSAEGSCQL